jgi:type VI secretion system secreted protein Hcp
MNIKTLIAGFGLLAAHSLAAQNIFIGPVNASSTPIPAAANFSGESRDINHVGWSEVKSAGFSIENPVVTRSNAGGGAAGKATFGTFIILKELDGSSPFFFIHSAQGKIIPAMTIDYGRYGERGALIYQTIVLKDVRVVSYKQNSADRNEAPMEEIGLSYGSVEITLSRNDANGRLARGRTFGWNSITNTPINP